MARHHAFLAVASLLAMASAACGQTINQLPSGAAVSSGDTVAAWQSGATKKVTAAQFKTFTSTAPALTGVPTTPTAALGTTTTQIASTAFALNEFGARAIISPLDAPYNCVGDGTTDDTTCMQAALTAASGGVLNLGRHLYKVGPLSLASTVTIFAPQGGGGIYQYNSCNAGFVAKTANENLLTLTGSGSMVAGVCFQMGSTFNSNTAGYAVKFGVGTNYTLQDSQINYPFVGVEVTGIGTNQNVKTVIQRNVIAQVNNNGVGIRVGLNSTAENTVDTYITDNSIIDSATNTAIGTLLIDSGGAFYKGNDVFQLGVGFKIYPGVNQIANGFFYDILGDSSYQNDVIVDQNGGGVPFAYFQDTWTSGSNAQDFLIQSTGAGGLGNIYLTNHHAQMHGGGSTAQIGIDIEGGHNIAIQGGDICGQNTMPAGSIGVKVAASVNYFAYQNVKSGDCGVVLPIALKLATGVGVIEVNGNQFNLSTVPVSWAPTTGNGDTAVFKDNIGIDNIVPNLASASTITLPLNPQVDVTGTTTIDTIQGGWSSREVDLVFGGSLTVSAAGNVCTSASVAAGQLLHIRWNQAKGCWAHQ